jgi:hypothetical protein
MLGTDIREIMAEEEQVQRRKEAIESLLGMRYKLLRESLEVRMRRAQNDGEWIHLSQKECAARHKQEKIYLTSQVVRLRHEQDRTRGKLAALRRTKARAKRIRAAEAASPRKRR